MVGSASRSGWKAQVDKHHVDALTSTENNTNYYDMATLNGFLAILKRYKMKSALERKQSIGEQRSLGELQFMS